MSPHTEDLELAIRAARAAGAVTLENFGGEHEVTHKSPDQPLTPSDLAANDAISGVLRAARPAYGWLSEETVDDAARLRCDRVWLVDPIDGTRSFIAGYPEYAVSIGLVERGEVVLGVVYVPPLDELYWAVAGEGARRSRRGADAERLRIPASGAERRPVLAASRSEIRRGEFAAFVEWDILPTGSTAYKLARVAGGEADGFVSRGTKSEWDVCAADLLVREAGGVVSDIRGERYRYNREVPEVSGAVAGTARVHEELLRMV